MKQHAAKRVINGTWGTCFIDDDATAEVTGMTATLALNKSDVNQCGTLMVGAKVISAKGTGSLKMNKVTSKMARIMGDAIKRGTFNEVTIISHLADPDAYGAERVKLTGVLFDDLTIADWEAAKYGEITANFTFDGYKYIEMIKEV